MRALVLLRTRLERLRVRPRTGRLHGDRLLARIRIGAIEAAYRRLVPTQDVVATFLGNGYGSTARLFEEGVLESDGFNAVDNELVSLSVRPR